MVEKMKYNSLIAGLAFAVAAVFSPLATAAATNAVPWRVPLYSLNAQAMSVREVFNTFGVAQGVPVLMSEAVNGKVSGVFTDVPAVDFMDKIATINNLVWYYDGATLFVNASAETQTILIDLKYMKAGEVVTMLEELGVEDQRFPLKKAQNDELIMVSGPPRYVALVSELIAHADKLREQRTFNEVEVRLFPLKHTWADTVSFTVSAPESSVPLKGVAELLEEMTKPGPRVHDGTNSLAAADSDREAMGITFEPVILAENRLNAVMVRDVSTRMPMYERLIRELDVPTKLLEIGITTIELIKEDALDWQLSLSVEGTHESGERSHAAGGGLNSANLLTPTDYATKGVSAAYSFIGKNLTIGASISALKSDGKTRSISRTSLLTMNNLAASINDTQTYNVRVSGERVAEVQSVSAGTVFKVKPRAVKSDSTNAAHRVWMTLEIQDGGFQGEKVDGIPLARTTTLTTQAVMNEGESLILSGYLRDVESESGWGIPWLRDIPWIGWIFGGQSKTYETVQRFFILTPRVIEIAGPDTAADQIARQRDLSEADALEEHAETVDDARKLRKIKRKGAREVREHELGKQVDELEAEFERDHDDRELDRRKFDHRLEKDVERWNKLRDYREQEFEEAVRAEAEAEAALKELEEAERK